MPDDDDDVEELIAEVAPEIVEAQGLLDGIVEEAVAAGEITVEEAAALEDAIEVAAIEEAIETAVVELAEADAATDTETTEAVAAVVEEDESPGA